MVETSPSGTAHGIVLLPDGDTCAVSAENAGEIFLVSLSEARVVDTLRSHAMPVNSLSLADGGRLLLSASDDRTVRVWDLESRQVVQVLEGHTGYVRDVAGAGMVAVSGSEDRTVAVWDLASGTRRAVFGDHDGSVDRVAVSSDGRRAVTASRNNDVLLWNLAEPRLEREIYRARMGVTPGLSYLVTGVNRTGRGHAGGPHGLGFDSAGLLYTAHREVIRWNPAEGAELLRFRWRGPETKALAAHPTLPLLAAIAGHAARVFSSDGTVLTVVPSPEPVRAPFVGGVLTGDGRLVTLDLHGAVRVWPGVTEAGGSDERHAGEVTAIRIDPTSRFAVTVSRDDDAAVWNLATGERTAVVNDLDPLNSDPAFTPDGTRLLAIARSRALHVQPTAGGAPWTLPAQAPGLPGGEPERVFVVDAEAVDDETLLVLQYDADPELWRIDGTGPRRPIRGDHGARAGEADRIVTADGRYALIPVRLNGAHPALTRPPGVEPGPEDDVAALQCWDLAKGELIWTRHHPLPHDDAWWDDRYGMRGIPAYYGTWFVDDRAAITFEGYDDGEYDLVLLDLPTNEVLRRVPVTPFHCYLGRLPDGALLIDDLTDLWLLRPGTGDLQRVPARPDGLEVRLVPGGDLLLSLEDTVLRAFQLGMASELASVDLAVPATRIEVSTDGSTAVLGDPEGGVRIVHIGHRSGTHT